MCGSLFQNNENENESSQALRHGKYPNVQKLHSFFAFCIHHRTVISVEHFGLVSAHFFALCWLVLPFKERNNLKRFS